MRTKSGRELAFLPWLLVLLWNVAVFLWKAAKAKYYDVLKD